MSTPETGALRPYITVYDTLISDEIAERLSVMFERNYPESHSDEDRANDVTDRSDVLAIQALLKNGRKLHVAFTEDGEPAGFLEERTVPIEGGVYEQLVWIIVGEQFRGNGLAGLLYQSFMRQANERAKNRPEQTSALLSVHKKNPAYNIYKHWGWAEPEETSPTVPSPGKVFMFMALPKEEI